MKGVSTVVATVLVLMITVALAASAYLFFSGTFSSTTQQGERIVNSSVAQTQSSFSVDSVTGSIVYIRNTGKGAINLSNVQVFYDNRLLNTSGAGVINPGESGRITINSFVDYGSGKSLRVGAGVAAVSVQVSSRQNYPDLVAYWKFDESTGATSFADSSGNKNDGSCFDVTYCPTSGATGKVNKAATFDKINDYIQVSDSSSLRLANKGSIEAWIYKNQNGGGIVSKTSGSGYYLIDQGGKMVLGWPWPAAQSNQVIPTGSWNHVAATHDGAQLKIYINGYLDKTQSSTEPVNSTGRKLYIGMETSGMRYGGMIDELRIWNRTLSADEIAAHYLTDKP